MTQEKLKADDFLTSFCQWATQDQLSLTNQTLQEARLSYLDTIACIEAGKNQAISTKIDKFNQYFYLNDIPTSRAMRYACQAGILDYDDYEAAGSSHPSAPIIAAVLSIAPQLNLRLLDILEAWVVGYEIIIRMGEALGYGHYAKGWHATSTYGPIGCAAAIGRLLRLSSSQFNQALSIASSSSAGMKLQFGSEAKVVHEGLAAQAGLQAAYLAQQGISAQKDFFDCPDGFKDLYGDSQSTPLNNLENISWGEASKEFPVIRKPWPSCAYTHRIIEAAEKIYQPSLNLEEIESVVISIPEPWIKVVRFDVPLNEAEARFSAPYCVMMALMSGSLGPDDFSNQIYLDPKRQELTKLASVQTFKVDHQFTEMSPDYPDSVKVTMKDGRNLFQSIGHVKGGSQNPMSLDDLKIKFNKCSNNSIFFDQFLNATHEETVLPIFNQIV